MAIATNDGHGHSGSGAGPDRDRPLDLGQSPFTLPNAITAARLLAALPIALLVAYGHYLPALWLFLAAALSDALDGFVAKRFNRRSVLGTWLDPAADKVLIVGCLLALAHVELVPAWLLALIILRDVCIALGAFALHWRSRLFRIQPLALGKATTLAQIVLIAVALVDASALVAAADLVWLLVYAVALLTLLSGAAYFAQGARLAFAEGEAS